MLDAGLPEGLAGRFSLGLAAASFVSLFSHSFFAFSDCPFEKDSTFIRSRSCLELKKIGTIFPEISRDPRSNFDPTFCQIALKRRVETLQRRASMSGCSISDSGMPPRSQE